MAPMYDTGSVTRARGDNSLDLVLGEEAGKAPDHAGMRSATDAGTHPQTRASLTDAQEEAVSEICVFQFDNATNTLKYSGYIALGTGTLTTDLSLATGMGVCTVYVLANMGDLTPKVAYGSSLADFQKLAAEVTSGKGTGDNLPMCGSNNNFDSNTANTLAISLTRSVAKVSLNLTTPNSGDVFTVSAIKLMNVAKKLHYVESAATAPSAPAELTDYTSNNSNAITWYIPENKVGTTSLSDWKDRYEGNAPATATYILIEGSYTPQNGTARDVSYAIYLGAGNNPADFNVARNTKYTVNAIIRGTNLDDGRVLVGKDLSAAGTRTANCYVVKTTDANKWYRFKSAAMAHRLRRRFPIRELKYLRELRFLPSRQALCGKPAIAMGLFTHWTTWAIPATATSCSSWAALLRAMQWLPPKTAPPKSFGAGISGQRPRLTGIVSRCRHTRQNLVPFLPTMRP